MRIFAASLCFLFALVLIINGSDFVNLALGVMFLTSGIGLLKRQEWARVLGLISSLASFIQFCRTIWAMTGGGEGRQLGLAAAPTMLLSLIGALAVIVAFIVIWRSLREPSLTSDPN